MCALNYNQVQIKLQISSDTRGKGISEYLGDGNRQGSALWRGCVEVTQVSKETENCVPFCQDSDAERTKTSHLLFFTNKVIQIHHRERRPLRIFCL